MITRKATKILFFFLTAVAFSSLQVKADAGKELPVCIKTPSTTLSLAIQRLQNRATKAGKSLLTTTTTPQTGVVVVSEEFSSRELAISKEDFAPIKAEGYALKKSRNGKLLYVIAKDPIGAQYGLTEAIDHWTIHGSLDNIKVGLSNPYLDYRILKFNLPWSPYRKNEATEIHMGVCRDLDFWEKFLDMMVDNRFNVLSLWNNHPFPFMIRSVSFPKATPFDEEEMAEWRVFWTSLFRMAKDRGIQTFIVNWNIVVSPQFAEAYGASEYNDKSPLVEAYTRECVRQVIDEYPDLTGIGVTLADWMGNFPEAMSPQERENWISRTFIAGMKEASRPVRFLHRSVLAGDPMAMRNLLDSANLKEPALVEIKFNWSHGHSTPQLAITHDFHSGALDKRFWDPAPANYDIQWMVRNEDFFILRWGQAGFIRKHVLQNKLSAINGYFIGSEGYIPALDYASIPSTGQTWQYAFEKQWLFYALWGRLLFDPHTPDSIFEGMLTNRFGRKFSEKLFQAYQLTSEMPLRLSSFYRSTWDYTLYSEGFIAAEPANKKGFFDRSSPFISIAEFVEHEVLDSNLISIKNFVALSRSGRTAGNKITPLALAEASENDSRKAISLISDLKQTGSSYKQSSLSSELDDLATWAYLGLYFSDKIRAGVAFEMYRQTGDVTQKEEAIALLGRCLSHWKQVVAHTEHRYQPVPHVANEYYGAEFRTFSWKALLPEVERDLRIVRDYHR